MATVKFDEGTKRETTLDLEDGESVIFVKPFKNTAARAIGMKIWGITIILTDRRLVTIPVPPNKKDIPIESYYYKNIDNAYKYKALDKTEDDTAAFFAINMKSDIGNSKFENKKGDNGYFMIMMEKTAKNFLVALINDIIRSDAKNPNRNAGVKAMDYSYYTAKSVDKYYAAMDKAAKDRAANLDVVNGGQVPLRDYFVDVTNIFVAEVNK
jgi:hypothetical protein